MKNIQEMMIELREEGIPTRLVVVTTEDGQFIAKILNKPTGRAGSLMDNVPLLCKEGEKSLCTKPCDELEDALAELDTLCA